MQIRALPSSWKRLSPPDRQERLDFTDAYTAEEADRILLGLIPKEMEDKWFVYSEGGRVHFHRSWTGALIYSFRMTTEGAGFRAGDARVNRVPEQYRGTDLAYDQRLLRFLVDALLLGKPATFPLPAGAEDSPAGVNQRTTVGRAYPDVSGDAT